VASRNRDLVRVTYGDLRPGDKGGSLMHGRKVVAVHPVGRDRVELHMAWDNGKPEKPVRVDKHRPCTVSRVIAGPGMPLRHRAEARSTGGIVEVWDTKHEESPITPALVDGHPWAMRCEHGTVVGRRTQDQAMKDVRDPRLWCDGCTQPSAKVGAGAMMLPL
jgi:hypothetical protein